MYKTILDLGAFYIVEFFNRDMQLVNYAHIPESERHIQKFLVSSIQVRNTLPTALCETDLCQHF